MTHQTNTASTKGRTGVLTEGRHTNLGSAHNPPSTAKIRITSAAKTVGSEAQQMHIIPTNAEGRHGEPKQIHTSPALQGPARDAETSAYQPRNTECVPRKLRGVHPSPRHRGWTLETESSAHRPHNTEGKLSGVRGAHTINCNAEGATQAPT